jgi:autotransporter-associated beta strand protein
LRPTANITNAVSVGTGQILQLNASRNTASTVGNYTGFDVTLNGGALRNRYGVNTFDRSITLTAASSIIARDTGGSLTINSGKLALAGNSLTIDSPNATAFIAINGGVTGTAASSLNMNNAGQLRLSGTNASFLGSLAVTNGEVRLDSATALGSSNAVTFGDNANTKTLTLNGNHQTIGGLSTGATVGTSIIQNANATGATLSVDLASGSNTFGGVLQDGTGGGALGLQKQGSGMLTLSGTNTYTGATTVNEGALSVGGSLATGSAVTVNNGGALKGVGDINGATTIKSGGILAPGNSVGKLEVADVKFESGSIFEWELAATPEDSYEPDGTTLTSPSVRGTSYDSTTVTGTFDTSTTGAKFRIKLDGTQTFADNFWDTNQKWTDIFATSAGVAITDWANVFTGGFEYYNASGTMRAPDASTRGSFTFTGGSTLTWTAVPEPTSALVGLLITAGLLRRRRN